LNWVSEPTRISNLEQPFGAGPFGTSFFPKLGIEPRPPDCGAGAAVTALTTARRVKIVLRIVAGKLII
jgi:hypothetical protein